MSTKILALLGADNIAVQVSPEAYDLKQKALDRGLSIIEVTTAEENEEAAAVARTLKGLMNDTEKFRKDIKAPILEAGKAIDGAASKFVKEIAAEFDRVKGLMTQYATKLELARQQAERERQELERKQREEAARAEQLRQQEEALRQQAAAAKTAKEAKALQQQIADVSAERIHTEFDVMNTADEAAAVVIPQRAAAEGTAVAPNLEITVTDIHALYAAFPQAVKLEPILYVIKDLINRQGIQTIPGVSYTKTYAPRISGVSSRVALQ